MADEMSENVKRSCDAMGVKMPNDDVVKAIGPDAHNIIVDNGFVLVPHEWRERCFRAADTILELRAINAELLAALERLYFYSTTSEAQKIEGKAEHYDVVMKAVRTAIAKAKGGA